MANLHLKNIHKAYQKSDVIHGLNLKVEEGEFVVLVGPSGCGKSTVLRMIAGLEEISSGNIYMDDKNINRLEPKHRDIAMVFQNYALYPHMTVFANMAYGLKMRKYAKAEIDKRVHEVAATLDLEKLLQRKPRELSGGQRQRVAMGRAIVRQPKLFLFDEPLSNLDAKLRVQMRFEIKRLHQRLKTTSIYVTHDQVEAMTLADRLVVFNAGCIEQVGTPLEIYHQPANPFVASFIGSPTMNLMQGEVIDKQFKLKDLWSLPLPEHLLDKTKAGTATLGIRPEHLVLSQQAKPGMIECFRLEVDVLEPLGADTLVFAHIPGDNHELVARLPGDWQAEVGSTIELSAHPDNFHLFNNS